MIVTSSRLAVGHRLPDLLGLLRLRAFVVILFDGVVPAVHEIGYVLNGHVVIEEIHDSPFPNRMRAYARGAFARRVVRRCFALVGIALVGTLLPVVTGTSERVYVPLDRGFLRTS